MIEKSSVSLERTVLVGIITLDQPKLVSEEYLNELMAIEDINQDKEVKEINKQKETKDTKSTLTFGK